MLSISLDKINTTVVIKGKNIFYGSIPNPLKGYFDFRARTCMTEWGLFMQHSTAGGLRYCKFSREEFYDRWKLVLDNSTTTMTIKLTNELTKNCFELLQLCAHGLIDKCEWHKLHVSVFEGKRPALKNHAMPDPVFQRLRRNYYNWERAHDVNRLKGGLWYRAQESLSEPIERFLRVRFNEQLALHIIMPLYSSDVTKPNGIGIFSWLYILRFLLPAYESPVSLKEPLKFIGYIMCRRLLIAALQTYIDETSGFLNKNQPARSFLQKVYNCHHADTLETIVKKELEALRPEGKFECFLNPNRLLYIAIINRTAWRLGVIKENPNSKDSVELGADVGDSLELSSIASVGPSRI